MSQIVNTLKITLLFAKFLYQHRQLNLPGIGVFSLDPSAAVTEINEKNSSEFAQHIRFTQKNIAKPDEDFIEFIRTQTGKIRPLAESDLESFLSEGKILLNIGKPFHLEGIGTIQNRSGSYEFYPGLPLLEKLENVFPEKSQKAAGPKQSYEQDYNPVSKSHQSGRMIWIAIAILIGLTAVIWGGYTLYNNNTDNDGVQATTSTPVEASPAPADTVKNTVPDTTAVSSNPATVGNTSASSGKPYKFIFRIAGKNYVLNRYNDLKVSNPNVNWDTKDSVTYRLFVSLPASPSDTARIRDSLRSWYGTKKIIIEQ